MTVISGIRRESAKESTAQEFKVGIPRSKISKLCLNVVNQIFLSISHFHCGGGRERKV